jgi:hypothetical protein
VVDPVKKWIQLKLNPFFGFFPFPCSGGIFNKTPLERLLQPVYRLRWA